MKLALEKLVGWGYCMVKISYPIFNRFCMIHPCDGQTDGRAIPYTRYSIYAVARNKIGSFWQIAWMAWRAWLV